MNVMSCCGFHDAAADPAEDGDDAAEPVGAVDAAVPAEDGAVAPVGVDAVLAAEPVFPELELHAANPVASVTASASVTAPVCRRGFRVMAQPPVSVSSAYAQLRLALDRRPDVRPPTPPQDANLPSNV
jgi:hypothetical protein